MTRTCREPGCDVTWEVVKSAGRPRVWCDDHGTTKASSRRNRSEPRKPKPACCPVRGKCPQHKRKQNPRRYVRNNTANWLRNGQALLDFVDVFGHAQILSDSGWPIHTWLPKDDDD
jgi:hypothetical protein